LKPNHAVEFWHFVRFSEKSMCACFRRCSYGIEEKCPSWRKKLMTSAQAALILRHLRRLASSRWAGQLHDAQLLECFRAQRDEAAFATLVRRHGPMVLNVCRSVLHHEQDAEDCFQATFLVLARKASSLRHPEAVAGWLCEVAFRVALKAQADSARRRARERRATPMKAADASQDMTLADLRRVLHEELVALPEKYRLPLVLCYLQGRTQEEAASQLGWSRGAFRGRLDRAREHLRRRLEARGVSPSAMLCAAAVAPGTAIETLICATVRAVTGATAKAGLSDAVSAKVILLAEGVSKTLFINKAKTLIVSLLIASLFAGGAAVLARQVLTLAEPSTPVATTPPKPEREQARRDLYGDPLPENALARLGTIRFRHGETIGKIVFSLDGKMLASGGMNAEVNALRNTVCIWDRASGKLLRRFDAGGARSGQVNLDLAAGGLLVTQDFKGTLIARDAVTGREIHRLAQASTELQHKGRRLGGRIIGLGFVISPDGKTVAARDKDKAIHLWELESGRERCKLTGDSEDYAPLAFSPDGKLLAVSADKIIRILNIITGNEAGRIAGFEEPPGACAFSADAKTLYALTPIPNQLNGDRVVAIDLATGNVVHHFNATTVGSPDWALFSRDGTLLLSGGYTGAFRIFNVKTGALVSRIPVPFPASRPAMNLSPDGKQLAAGGWTKTIQFWDVESGKVLPAFEGHQGVVHGMGLHPDGNTLFSVAEESEIWCWDISSASPKRKVRFRGEHISALAVSPDGTRLAASVGGSTKPFVRLLDSESGQELHRFTDSKDGDTSAAFSPDGKLLATAGRGIIRLRNVQSKRTQREIAVTDRNQGVGLLAFSPDGNFIAGGVGDQAQVWQVATGKRWASLSGHQNDVRALCFSPDGKTLATASWDKVIHLWEVWSGQERASFLAHDDRILSLAFSPDGRLLASGSDDKTIRLWNLADLQKMTEFRGHLNSVGRLAFSGDSDRLFSAGWDSTILVWDMRKVRSGLPPAAAHPSKKEMDRLWAELADRDSGKAYQAIRALIQAPTESVELLEKRVRPAEALDPKELTALITALDDRRFANRDKAARELEKAGECAAPALRQALTAPRSLEVRRRIEALLEKAEGPVETAEYIRLLRAVEVLEQIGTRGAKQVLQALATRGAPAARLTHEAQASLDRLKGRPPAGP
jgi:RNA polymerase sigma factor (sigma-70 family)